MTVGEESATDGRHSMPRTTRAASLHVTLLADGSVMEKTGSNVSLLSKMARSLPSVFGVELAHDARNVATVFLQDHRVEAGGFVWVPPEHGKAVPVVHEVTDRVGEGTSKTPNRDTESTTGTGLGKGSFPVQSAQPWRQAV